MCPQLARIEGLAKGAAAVTGATRYTDQEGKTVRRGPECLRIYFALTEVLECVRVIVYVSTLAFCRHICICIAMFDDDCIKIKQHSDYSPNFFLCNKHNRTQLALHNLHARM